MLPEFVSINGHSTGDDVPQTIRFADIHFIRPNASGNAVIEYSLPGFMQREVTLCISYDECIVRLSNWNRNCADLIMFLC